MFQGCVSKPLIMEHWEHNKNQLQPNSQGACFLGEALSNLGLGLC